MRRRWSNVAAWVAVTLLASASCLLAQCPMCRTAVQQDAAAAHALNRAILLLLVPAVGLFCGIFLLAFRSRNAGSTEPRGEDHQRP